MCVLEKNEDRKYLKISLYIIEIKRGIRIFYSVDLKSFFAY